LQNAKAAIAQGVVGIVISPTDSAAAPEVLDVAMHAGVPVVIADVGTNGGDYVTYVKSDNYRGAYDTGAELAQAFKEHGWNAEQYTEITISLARKNGKDRTNGFRDAMKDAGMTKELLPPKEMVDYSADETNRYVKDILAKSPNVRGLFIETDQPVQGALQALKTAKKTGDVLIVSFDAMPEVADLLKSGTLVAVGMQQPYLMGNKAAEALIGNLHGTPQAKQVLVPILVANNKNIVQLMPIANKTVFGRETK
jgi:ribose transport system substrate-binding protein